MTERKRIVIDVRMDGTMAARTEGIKGPACLDEVPRIEALCGEVIDSSKLRPDYEEASAETVSTDAAELREQS